MVKDLHLVYGLFAIVVVICPQDIVRGEIMSGLAPTGPVPGKPWTLFIYADGNNNLDRQIHREYLDLAEKGVSKDVNVILRMAKNGKVNDYMLTSPTQTAPQVMALGGEPPPEDQMAKRWKIESAEGYFKRFGLTEPWDRQTRPGHIPIADYVFTKEQAHEVAVARAEKPLYAVPLPGGVVNTDLNMGDPETLSSFLKLGIKSYPAQHYAVLFHDHGEAYKGLCEDDFHGRDSLSLEELKSALAGRSP
ncbi:MAG: hypothetical protein HYU64_04505 [Armatimonadetes bacterium]|nr:hypothetical protein [Armatimonadota bacterium]